MKKLISILLCVIMLASLIPAAVADGGVEPELRFNPYGGTEDSIDTVAWFKVGSDYVVFLPADCDAENLTVYCKGNIVVDGRKLTSGVTSALTVGDHTLLLGGSISTLTVMQSENIPAMYLETESGSLDHIHASKDNKEKAVIRTYENGELTLDSELKQIKGRGNSTWNYPKKPYNIKFDEKTSLLGMPKAKKWTLLASYIEQTLIRNPLSWELSDLMGLDFASDYRFVDLYVNGEYLGNYIVCESVEIGKDRVDITDLTKATEKKNELELEEYSRGGTGKGNTPESVYVPSSAKWVNIPNDPKDITGGYLLECEVPDRYESEISGFVTDRAQAVVIKEPEYASEAQVKYISGYWQEAEDAICSPDGVNALGKHYSEYFDVDSLVNMYILLELSGNRDAGVSSTYFYKDAGGKLVASPIWDSDTAFGNLGIVLQTGTVQGDPTMWIINRANYNSVTNVATNNEYPTVYNRLFRLDDFRAAVSERWAQLRETVLTKETVLGIANELADTVRASAIMNGVRWTQIFTEKGYASALATATHYLSERLACLDRGFGENAAQVRYDINGGTGWTVERAILENGDPVIVKGAYCPETENILNIPNAPTPEFEPPREGLYFAGWNTEADGSGKTYQPGDILTANGDITLYAQWKETQPAFSLRYKLSSLLANPIIELLRSLASVIKTLLFTTI